jgi:hypothetical protein
MYMTSQRRKVIKQTNSSSHKGSILYGKFKLANMSWNTNCSQEFPQKWTHSSWFTPVEPFLKMWDQMRKLHQEVFCKVPTKWTHRVHGSHRKNFSPMGNNPSSNWEQPPKFNCSIGSNNPSSQLGTTTQVQLPNWEQQPKFPIGNNHPSSQLCLVFIKELIFFWVVISTFQKQFFLVENCNYIQYLIFIKP